MVALSLYESEVKSAILNASVDGLGQDLASNRAYNWS